MRSIAVVGCTVGLLMAGACTSAGTVSSPPPSAAHSASPSPSDPSSASSHVASVSSAHTSQVASPTSTTAHAAVALGPAQRALNRMNLAQRVGQLLMVDCPSSGVVASTIASIRRYYAGSVILDGDSTSGRTRTHQITGRLQGLAPRRVKLFIAADQEGGLVQRLRGQGFRPIPSAVVQGTWTAAHVRSFARIWGAELRAAGVNLDLAPVLDTVPRNFGSNPPIGDLDREYGHTPAQVAAKGVAAAQGLTAAGVNVAVKHFPGLGRVRANTDTTQGVTDRVTTRHDRFLLPFRTAVQQHVPFVMVSSAIYARIDRGTPAVFSPTIVTGMLRHDLGFKGVIITDDVGQAAQVAATPPGLRAVDFVRAGGTMVLTVSPSTVAPMAARLIARAQRVPAFRTLVNAAALTVLRAKSAAGLLH